MTSFCPLNTVKVRTFALLLVLAVLCEAAGTARAAEKPNLPSQLDRIYVTAYDEALNRHARLAADGTTYVSSGDIDAEWLRDAAAVMEPYIVQSGSDGRIREVLRGVVARHARDRSEERRVGKEV